MKQKCQAYACHGYIELFPIRPTHAECDLHEVNVADFFFVLLIFLYYFERSLWALELPAVLLVLRADRDHVVKSVNKPAAHTAELSADAGHCDPPRIFDKKNKNKRS